MPSTVNSVTPFRPFRMIVLPALVMLVIGYLWGNGAFSGAAANTKPSVCSTPAATTTPQR